MQPTNNSLQNAINAAQYQRFVPQSRKPNRSLEGTPIVVPPREEAPKPREEKGAPPVIFAKQLGNYRLFTLEEKKRLFLSYVDQLESGEPPTGGLIINPDKAASLIKSWVKSQKPKGIGEPPSIFKLQNRTAYQMLPVDQKKKMFLKFIDQLERGFLNEHSLNVSLEKAASLLESWRSKYGSSSNEDLESSFELMENTAQEVDTPSVDNLFAWAQATTTSVTSSLEQLDTPPANLGRESTAGSATNS